jgi:hypothetical protein
MPGHPGAGSAFCNAMVCGSRKSSRLRASATMIAERPSGVKYMLYGLSTSTGGPGRPVIGSIGVSAPLPRRSALFATHSVFRSQDGTTCCGLIPTLKRSTTFSVLASITQTSCERRLGTYTRGSAFATSGRTLPAAVSL